MKSEEYIGILIIIGIIFIGLFGGSKGGTNNGLTTSSTAPTIEKQVEIQRQINTTQTQVEELKREVQVDEEQKSHSKYYGLVTLSYVNRSTDSSQEYVVIRSTSATTSIKITGWTVKSLNSGVSIKIPQGSYLFFAGIPNTENDIYLNPNETLYLITGISPNGASFKSNKCSGYLNQFQTFVPYLSSSCPAARDEDLSSIPKTTINDACLDYIDSYPMCRIQTDTLPLNWSYECTNFIYNKLNYSSCVDAHKNDKDFYGNEWRVYLKRSDKLWKDRREDIILYDDAGKTVSELKY